MDPHRQKGWGSNSLSDYLSTYTISSILPLSLQSLILQYLLSSSSQFCDVGGNPLQSTHPQQSYTTMKDFFFFFSLSRLNALCLTSSTWDIDFIFFLCICGWASPSLLSYLQKNEFYQDGGRIQASVRKGNPNASSS